MRILLTGSGGFLGKNLKKYLSEKYELLTPRSYELDLTDKNAVKEYFENNDINFVIHCASTGGARGVEDKDTTVEENIAMAENLLEFKKTNTRVILFGSGAMYDKSRSLHRVKENEIGKTIPKDLYGKSKMLIAQKIKDRKDVICLNIFACYGYDEKESRFPSYAVNCVLNDEDIVINQNVVFDYLFVEDAEKIIEYFIKNEPKTNIINITPDESVTLLQIAETVKKISQKTVRITIKNPEMNNEYTGDNTELKTNFPKIKFTPLNEGLEKLYNYLSKQKNIVK